MWVTLLRLQCASTHSDNSPFSSLVYAGNRAATATLAGSINPRRKAPAMLKRLTTTPACSCLGTSLAVAQTAATRTTAPAPAPTTTAPPAASGTATMPATHADSDMKELADRQDGQGHLPQALTTAEAQGEEKGGRAIDADFEKADGKDPAHLQCQGGLPERQTG